MLNSWGVRLAGVLTPTEREVYLAAVDAFSGAGIPFMIVGGYAVAYHTNQVASRKDLDFGIIPAYRGKAIEALTRAGLLDLFDQEPYDRGWIYRSIREMITIDTIWCSANYTDTIDEAWISRAKETLLLDRVVKIIAPEELIRMKLHVLQAKRCDWIDCLNIIEMNGDHINWERLRTLVGRDQKLLQSLILTYQWLKEQEGNPNLLDSRPWFLSKVKGV